MASRPHATGTTPAWTLVISPRNRWWRLDLVELWQYRDLLLVFIRCECLAIFKRRNVFGPVWFLLQPLIMTLLYTVIFTKVAKIPTNGLPPMLFYMAGTTPWNYFAACLQRSAGTLTANSSLLGKAYFPRLVLPIAMAGANLIQFASQFLLFFIFLGYYYWQGLPIHPHWRLLPLLTPVLLVQMAALGVGMGLLVAALTTKYRDLNFLLNFGLQLGMFATPVIYPERIIPPQYQAFLKFNPMSPVIQSFRTAFIGGTMPWEALAWSGLFTLGLLVVAIIWFKHAAAKAVDTI